MRDSGPINQPTITVDGDVIRIDALTTENPALASLLRRRSPDHWAETVERVLDLGTQGLVSMGVGVSIDEVDERMRLAVTRLTDEAQRRIDGLLSAARGAFAEQLDPDVRSSTMARALDEFHGWRDGFLDSMDPDRADSHTARLMASLADLVGPNGSLEARLGELMDPGADESAFRWMADRFEERFGEIRDLILRWQGAEAEAERGSRKGFDFEDDLEELIRDAVRAIDGAYVDRTGTETGSLDADSRVGDFVVTLASGHRIAVEAKNVASIRLGGKGGVLAELDRALANRRAHFAVCVSAREAFPSEVGRFGVFGNRLLVVEGGDGLLTRLALRWAAAHLVATQEGGRLDAGAIEERLARIRGLVRQFSNTQRSLTQVRSSVQSVQNDLDTMRIELVAALDDIDAELNRAEVAPDAAFERLRAVGDDS